MAFLGLLVYFTVVYLAPSLWIERFRHWQLVDLTTIVTAAFLAVAMAVTRKGLVKVPHTLAMAGLLLAAVGSHVAHTYLAAAQNTVVVFGKLLVMYLLIVNTVTSERRFRLAIWCLVILTALLAVHGLQQYHTGVGWGGRTLRIDQRIQWVGMFHDPNDLALAFVMMVPVLLSHVFRRAVFLFKIVPTGLVAMLIYGIYLTNSRGGTLALMATVVFFFIKRSKWVVPGGILGGLMATGVFLFGPSRLGMLSAEEASAYGRLDAWYYGFQLLKANPLFGVGYGLFTDQYPLTAHNSFLLAASELGLVGLCAWMSVFYTSFKGLSLVQHHHPRLAPFAYGLQASLVGFGAGAFFLSRTYNELSYLLCGMSAALFHVVRQQVPAIDFRLTRRDLWGIGAWSLGALALIQVAMKTWL